MFEEIKANPKSLISILWMVSIRGIISLSGVEIPCIKGESELATNLKKMIEDKTIFSEFQNIVWKEFQDQFLRKLIFAGIGNIIGAGWATYGNEE